MYYRKKPIKVTAVQWFPGIPHPAVKQISAESWDVRAGEYYVSSIEQPTLFLKPGCWIVGPGVKNEYWVVQDEIFRETYEEVE